MATKTIVNPQAVGGGQYYTNSNISGEEPLIADENEYIKFAFNVATAYRNNDFLNYPQLVSEFGRSVLYNVWDVDCVLNDYNKIIRATFTISVVHIFWQSEYANFFIGTKERDIKLDVENNTIEELNVNDNDYTVITDGV